MHEIRRHKSGSLFSRDDNIVGAQYIIDYYHGGRLPWPHGACNASVGDRLYSWGRHTASSVWTMPCSLAWCEG